MKQILIGSAKQNLTDTIDRNDGKTVKYENVMLHTGHVISQFF